jgi:cytidylate kinase
MTALTISRETGSGGDLLSKKIAQTLGYHLVDKECLAELLGKYGFINFAKEYETLPGFWAKFDAQREKNRELMVELLNMAVQAMAVHGNVLILGRSGFSALQGYADVFHVRLQAPTEARAKRLMKEQNFTHDEAIAALDESDIVRATFVEEFYGISWNSARAFDLVINTDKVSIDLAQHLVVNCMKAFETMKKNDKPSTRIIEVDSVLQNAISEVLNCRMVHNAG